jgi:hypothetical protein
VNSHSDEVDESTSRKERRREITGVEKPRMSMERTTGVVNSKVLHGLVPGARAGGMVASSRESVSKRLGKRALTEGQGIDDRENSEDGNAARCPSRNIEMEAVDASLLSRGAAVNGRRRIEHARNGSTTRKT